MSLKKTIKKVIEVYPHQFSTRSEALIYLLCSKNTYKWSGGSLVSRQDSAKKKLGANYKLPFEAVRLIDSMKRVNKKQAKSMEQKFKKAHKRDMDKVKKTLREIDKRISAKTLPRKVDTFYSKSPIFKLPKNIKGEWKLAVIEALTFVLKKDPTHKQANFLKEKYTKTA